STQRSMKYFEVLITLDEQDPERMKPGMPVSTTILAADLEDVISVPLYSVFEENGKPYVYLLNGGEPERQSVELGTRSKARAVVLNGLAEGDWIAMRNPYLSYAEYAGQGKGAKKDEKKEGGI
ncbi:hypothetical protein ACFLU6_05720, partial [Acidobacteriota bacterium]